MIIWVPQVCPCPVGMPPGIHFFATTGKFGVPCVYAPGTCSLGYNSSWQLPSLGCHFCATLQRILMKLRLLIKFGTIDHFVLLLFEWIIRKAWHRRSGLLLRDWNVQNENRNGFKHCFGCDSASFQKDYIASRFLFNFDSRLVERGKTNSLKWEVTVS